MTERTLLSGYLDEDEAAREFRRTKQTLRRWRRQKIGPPWADTPAGPFYPIADGQQWLRASHVQPRTKSA
jgi:hypothetical protein